MNSLKTLRIATLALLPALAGGVYQAQCQTPPEKTSAQSGQKADPPTPHHPPRVVSDLAQFHLDRQPHPTSQPQVSAGSRGSGSTALILCAPVAGLTSSTHPLFQWKIPEGNPSQVTFTLLSASGDVVYENDVTGMSFEYPAQATPLEPGQTYSWKVTGGGMNSLPEPAQIEVQSVAEHNAVQKLAMTGDAASDSLAHAQVFLHNRLWYDTVAALDKSIREYPDRKDLKDQLTALYRQVVPACVSK